MDGLEYQQKRHTFADGAWSTAHILRAPAQRLKFEDLHPMNSYVRQQDVARSLYAQATGRGDSEKRILTWAAMQTDRRASQVFPELDHATDGGERIISANSFITYALRHMLSRGWLQLHEYIGDTYEWRVGIPPGHRKWEARAESVLRWLEEAIQLDLYPNIRRGTYQPRLFEALDVHRNFARIGRCDFARSFTQNHARAAVFNTSHFLHEPEDLISHHSGYGDALGLMVAAGTILRPPIYTRGALLFDGERWRIEAVGMADIALLLSGETRIGIGSDAALNPKTSRQIAIYTRGARLQYGQPMQGTPQAEDRSEFVIVNRQVVSWKRGGQLYIPQNGFVLSICDGALPAGVVDGISGDGWIEYEFAPQYARVQAAIQAGPILLRNGEDARVAEEFGGSAKSGAGIPPAPVNPGAADSRKARTAIGVQADGDLLIVVVDGCEAGFETWRDSSGATLDELRGLLLDAGAVDALNLSGGGASCLFMAGGLANAPSDRRGQPGVVYEPMLPSIGVVL